MTRFSMLPAAIAIASSLICATEASATDGVKLITQAKALAGNVTPGDAAGFPVTLSLPGSYRLADNLAPPAAQDGISVEAPDITIDLNGFRMSGGSAGGVNNARDGIVDLSDRLTVKNGTIGAFTNVAIDARKRLYLIIENMRIINSGIGIYNTDGSFSSIQGSTVATNVQSGIDCGLSCQIEGNVISGNGHYGVAIGSGTVLGNTFVSNKSYAISVSAAEDHTVGFGNNTLVGNNRGGTQVFGNVLRLFPNACSPVAC